MQLSRTEKKCFLYKNQLQFFRLFFLLKKLPRQIFQQVRANAETDTQKSRKTQRPHSHALFSLFSVRCRGESSAPARGSRRPGLRTSSSARCSTGKTKASRTPTAAWAEVGGSCARRPRKLPVYTEHSPSPAHGVHQRTKTKGSELPVRTAAAGFQAADLLPRHET